MNMPKRKYTELIDRLTELSGKDRADVQVEDDMDVRLSYLAVPRIITGSYSSDYGPDDGIVYDSTVCFRIEIEPHFGMVNVWSSHWTNEEGDFGNPWFEYLIQGREAFTKAEEIADAIEAALTEQAA